MRVLVKLYANLREYAPSHTEIGEAFHVEFNGNTLQDLIRKLGFELDRAKIVMVNGNRIIDVKAVLNEDDLVVIFPPIGGG